MNAARRTAVFVVTAIAVLASCADPGPERTVTADQALAEVQATLRQSEQALGAPLRSDAPSGPQRTDCSDPVDGGPQGRIYWAAYYGTSRPETRPAGEALPSLDELVTRMQRLGWSVAADRRSVPGSPEVMFERPSEIELRVSFAGNPILGYDVNVDTACVWPNGVRP